VAVDFGRWSCCAAAQTAKGTRHTNIDALWIDPFDYRQELYEAATLLDDFGLRTSIYNHQLCTIDRRIWPLAVKSVSDWKNEYRPECSGCAVMGRCGGFFATGRLRQSSHIRPVSMKASSSVPRAAWSAFAHESANWHVVVGMSVKVHSGNGADSEHTGQESIQAPVWFRGISRSSSPRRQPLPVYNAQSGMPFPNVFHVSDLKAAFASGGQRGRSPQRCAATRGRSRPTRRHPLAAGATPDDRSLRRRRACAPGEAWRYVRG
jgi:hypothetical protein